MISTARSIPASGMASCWVKGLVKTASVMGDLHHNGCHLDITYTVSLRCERYSIGPEPAACKLFLLAMGGAKMFLAPSPCQLDLSLPFGKTSGTCRILGRFAMMATDAILKIRMRHFCL